MLFLLIIVIIYYFMYVHVVPVLGGACTLFMFFFVVFLKDLNVSFNVSLELVHYLVFFFSFCFLYF